MAGAPNLRSVLQDTAVFSRGLRLEGAAADSFKMLQKKLPCLGGGGMVADGYGASLWGDENVLEWDNGNGCTSL